MRYLEFIRGKSEAPTKAYPTDAGFDLHLYEDITIQPNTTVTLPIDTRVRIPEGYFGLVVPRSSYRMKGLIAHAIIDPHYTGPLSIVVTYVNTRPLSLKKGDRPVQLIILPTPNITLIEVQEFNVAPSQRNENGLGSSGR